LAEAAAGVLEVGVGERADELVPAYPDHRVVGAQVVLYGGDDIAQQRVARGMALAVVELLESVDVHEGEYEPSVSVSSAIDLVFEGGHPEVASVGASELIELSPPEL